jgi:hydroxyethylthiazole kinase-like uncharacterized protein yjeF
MAAGPVITVAQLRALDANAAAHGVPVSTLMENAGAAVALEIQKRFSPRPTAVLCGPGHNGGDGWVCAARLMAMGWPVWVETLCPTTALVGDVGRAAALFTGAVHPLGEAPETAALAVDALFGAGLSRPLDGAALAACHAWAPRWRAVVAVDLPSGLAGEAAEPVGGVAFRAGLTVTFAAAKPAHLLHPARSFCGALHVAEIGVPAQAWRGITIDTFENDQRLWGAVFPSPDNATHKHARGHVMVVSGGLTQTGASRLAAMGALRAGAGLVTVLSPPDALLAHATQLSAIMLRKVADAAETASAAGSANSVVIGPAAGVTTKTRESVLALATGQARLVVDADALSVFSEAPEQLFAALRPDDVLTPHVGEFNRVFPGLLGQSPSRLHAARVAAEKAGCILLLKGPDTVIAAPDGRCAINATGTPYLATAGSGDVLAGFIAALQAQGMPSFEAACAAAWLHGRCGEALGAGLIAEDLPHALPPILKRLR